MHDRVKSEQKEKEANKTQEEKDEENKRVKMYQEVKEKVFLLKKQNTLNPTILPLTSHLLLLNPEFQMIWGYRRDILLHLLFDQESKNDTLQLQEIIKTEFKLTMDALQRNPKSYSAWFQRQWIIDQFKTTIDLVDLKKEISLCNKLLDLDERNFHCWNYRRHIARLAGLSHEEEFIYSTHKIEQNFSNYSAIHHRTLALPRPLTEDVLYKEIELIQQAVFTEPDDQSGWFYYRWVFSSLIQRTKDIVFFTQKQIEWVQELVDIEENSKWAIGTLAFLYKNLYKNIQEEEEANNAKNKAIELYQQLQEIDSGHAFYYQDMITSMQ